MHEPFWSSSSAVRKHFHLHIRTGLLTGMPLRQDVWSRSAPSWYQKDSASESDKASEGTQAGAGGTLAAPAPQVDNTETWAATKEKLLQVAPADLWMLQKILSSKKGSVSQTYKTNSEANTKVYDLNHRTMQDLNNFAIVYATLNKLVQLGRSRFLRRTCSSPTCVRGRACRSSTASGTHAR